MGMSGFRLFLLRGVPEGAAPLAGLLAASVLVVAAAGFLAPPPPGPAIGERPPAASRAVVEIRAGTEGRLAAVFAALGRSVERGALLARLEDEALRREHTVARARLDWLTAEALVLRDLLGEDPPEGDLPMAVAEPVARLRQRYRDLQALTLADAVHLEAYAQAARAESERLGVHLARLRRRLGVDRAPVLSLAWLREGSGPPPDGDAGELRARHDALAARLSALRESIARAEREAEEARRRWRALLQARLDALDAERPALAAEAARLAARLQATEIRAPVAGRIVETAPLQPGDPVPEGALLFRIARREDWPPW